MKGLLDVVGKKLGISKASTIDADLEYVEDSRWYVRTGTIIFQFFGV